MVSSEAPERRAYVAQVLSELLHLIGEGEVALEFGESEEGQMAVALHIASADSPLKGRGEQKSALALGAVEFLLNKLLGSEASAQDTGAHDTHDTHEKVFLSVDGFPQRPPANLFSAGPEAEEVAPGENTEQFAALASALAQKCATHGRIYAVLLLSKAQRMRMRQAAMDAKGLRVISEGEAHWSRLVFEPNKPTPMPQKSRIVLDKEGLAHPKSPRALS